MAARRQFDSAGKRRRTGRAGFGSHLGLRGVHTLNYRGRHWVPRARKYANSNAPVRLPASLTAYQFIHDGTHA